MLLIVQIAYSVNPPKERAQEVLDSNSLAFIKADQLKIKLEQVFKTEIKNVIAYKALYYGGTYTNVDELKELSNSWFPHLTTSKQIAIMQFLVKETL